MAPLALYLAQAGYRISGSDSALKPDIRNLLESQKITITSEKGLPEDIDCVIHSNAVKAGHPVLKQAHQRGLPTIKRGHMLAKIAADKKLIAVVGSHGKTTTTALMITAFQANCYPADFILGGFFNQTDAKLHPPSSFNKSSQWLIAEVDESDGTIEAFNPDITLVLNLDWDHTDYYSTPKVWEKTLKRLFKRTKETIFISSKCPILKRLTRSKSAKVKTFGAEADYSGEIAYSNAEGLRLTLGKSFTLDSITAPVPGQFNSTNILAALAVTQHLKGSISAQSLTAFPGIQRRQTRLYHSAYLTVYEDYAHHPVEIAALIAFARSAYPKRQIITVFQPHRYSRTRVHKTDFAATLQTVDALFLMEVYSAGDLPEEGGHRADLLRCFDTQKTDCFIKPVDALKEVQAHIADRLEKPTVLLFVGAGDIHDWAVQYTAELKNAPISSKPENWWMRLQHDISPASRLNENEPLAKKVTLRVGGPARYYAEPADLADLRNIILTARQAKISCFILGRGSNLIVLDKGFDGLVICLRRPYWKHIKQLDDGRVRVRAGVRLKQICENTCRRGLAGFEFLEGIPGSLGGALRMNAGAMGKWIFERVESVRLLTWEGELKTIQADKLQISYRDCPDIARAIAISAVLRPASQAQRQTIQQTTANYADRRRVSQPHHPSAGCIFKNPKNIPAGLLIEQLGLKGLRRGAAEVSTIHGNFIINRGGASSADVLSLIQEIREKAKAQCNIDLEPEALLLGQSWSTLL